MRVAVELSVQQVSSRRFDTESVDRNQCHTCHLRDLLVRPYLSVQSADVGCFVDILQLVGEVCGIIDELCDGSGYAISWLKVHVVQRYCLVVDFAASCQNRKGF